MLHKNVLLVLLGKLVSVFGNRIFSFSISFVLLTKTGSGLTFGISLALSTIPRIIISPIAGIIVDKFSKKKILIFADMASAITMLALVFTDISLIYIYISVFLLSIIGSVFDVAVDASIPELSGKKALRKINSISSSITYLATILSPIIGGYLVIYFDLRLFAIINGVTFLLSGISEYFIIFDKKSEISTDTKILTFFIDMKNAIKYIKSNQILLVFISSNIILNFAFSLGYTVALPFSVLNEHKMTSTNLGYINASMSIGSILTSILLISKKQNHNKSTLSKFPISAISILAFCLMLFGLVNINSTLFINQNIIFVIFCSINLVVGICAVIFNIHILTTIQLITSKEHIGRVIGLVRMSMYLSIPISVILAGYITSILPSEVLFVSAGFIMIFTVLYIGRINLK